MPKEQTTANIYIKYLRVASIRDGNFFDMFQQQCVRISELIQFFFCLRSKNIALLKEIEKMDSDEIKLHSLTK